MALSGVLAPGLTGDCPPDSLTETQPFASISTSRRITSLNAPTEVPVGHELLDGSKLVDALALTGIKPIFHSSLRG
jgi:hypothetical protein